MKNYKTSEEKFNIIMGAINTNITVVDLCHKYGMVSSAYYRWKEQFFEGARNGSSREQS